MIRPASPPPVLSNPRADRVREVARLATRQGRQKTGLFLAEGPQAVREALRLQGQRARDGGDAVVEQVYATGECLRRHPELAAESAGVELRLAEPEVVAAMADTVTPQGVVAVCRLPRTRLEDVLEARPRLVAVLCRVQDPGNAGTILRAADAAGADAVLLTEGSVDIYNPKAVRSTVGSLFHLPVVTGVPLEAAAGALREAGLSVLAADGYGSDDLDGLQDDAVRRHLGGEEPGVLAGPTAWLFGNEGAGLAQEELRLASRRVAVPLYGVAESLNVGTAATVCLYASARAQRRGGTRG
ncbi:TrmH family RNA methyltransferase [Zafaria sp. Z1313]|uniref:TrmH family RNA methyltransferase n=1 Tax=unclassified Zafaria TaxID=2828765 RepID=UPI002E764164|nr:RNA methyltransferase [Zafaria sp. J156]MEE1621991.1 RNA methyltransferase [Zafaria sp. J156]